jgi:hypothetical protein
MSQLIFSLDKTVTEKGTVGSNIYKAIASTAALDRDREVLVPKGAVTDSFMKNPVMLMIHNYKQVPIGKVLSIDITKDAVSFSFTFADTEDGNELKGLYDTGFMNAFSVGLYPLKSMWIEDQTPDQFEITNTDGTKDTFDLTKYKIKPQRVVLSWELLEISPVPVPSNPEALLIRAKEDIIRKTVEGQLSKAAGQLLEYRIDKQIETIKFAFDSDLEKLSSLKSSNVIEYVKTPIDVEKSWDGLRAQASLAKWSSSDESGEKDLINWGEYARGFAYVNVDKADKLSSYKFTHHHVIDKEVVAIFKGVAKSMASLLSSKEVYGDDAKSIYEHLAEHYKDAVKECPPFEDNYTEDQLKAIADGLDWTVKSDPENESNEDDASKDPVELVSDKKLDQILETLVEFDEVIRLRFTLMADTLDAIHGDVKSLSTSEEKSDDEDPDTSENVIEDQLKSLTEFLKQP